MVTSILGSVAGITPASGAGAPAPAALQAQLQQLQQQLSDCVNCSTAKTVQGKASIDAARAKISQVEQRIARAADADARRQAASAVPNPLASAAVAATRTGIDLYA